MYVVQLMNYYIRMCSVHNEFSYCFFFYVREFEGFLNLVGLLGTTAVNGSVIRLYL